MIGRVALDPARRAELIHAEARSALDIRLWRAALGDTDNAAEPAPGPAAANMRLDSLLALLGGQAAPPPSPSAATPSREPTSVDGPAPRLGANAHHAPALAAAARRTGLPAAAVAAIIDAEAGRGADGAWRTDSRNPRSTARGLGQFLAGTWLSEAQRAGTWLNHEARARGWLGADGHVLPAARSALLALRDDARASIEATADYARQSLDRVAAAGLAIGESAADLARTAYVGHNLGPGDALRFLAGGLGEGRARQLLAAQIGPERAAARIAAAGSAVAAHRDWLGTFIARRVQPGRFVG